MKLAQALICIALLSSPVPRAAPVPHVDTQARRPPSAQERVIKANQMPGADAGAKINAADAALGATKGTIIWTGPGTAAASIIIAGNHTLRLEQAQLTSTANNPVIRLKDNSALECDSWASTISESTGVTTVSSPLNIVADYNGSQLNGARAQNLAVRGCHLKGHAPVTGTVRFTNGSTAITASSPLFTSAMTDYTGHWTIYAAGVTFGGSGATTIATVTDATHATLADAAHQSTSAMATIIHFSSTPPAISLGNCQNCVVERNWLERTHSIGINIGGGSMAWQYAQNFIVRNNLLTGVASQNLSITNADGAQLLHNTIRGFSQAHGPGSNAIDVEPNTGDRCANVVIDGNIIDNADVSPPPIEALIGITVQNGNGATPYGPVLVTNNRVLGAPFNQPVANNIQAYGLLVRTAAGVTLKDNYIQRVAVGWQLDYSANNNLVEHNICMSCGSGGTATAVLDNAANNRIRRNIFISNRASPVPGLDALARHIVETGQSDGNIFEDNDAAVTKKGLRSVVIGRQE